MAFQLIYNFADGGDQYIGWADFVSMQTQVYKNGDIITGGPTFDASVIGFNEGEVMFNQCSGTTLWRASALFDFPYITLSVIENVRACGYVPPAPCTIDLTIETNNAINNTASGQIIAYAAPAGFYYYSLDSFTWQTNNVFDELFPGDYTVYVKTRGNTCSASAAVTVGMSVQEVIGITPIPYKDSKNVCFFFKLIIDGVTHYVSEPLKWDSVNIIGERDKDYHGYQFKYTDGDVTLGFDCPAGRDLIEGIYNEFGEDGEILFQYGYSYKGTEYIQFPGKLMLNSYKWYADRVESMVQVDDFDDTFQSRLETKVTLTQTESFDGVTVTPPAPFRIQLHPKAIFAQLLTNKPNVNYDSAGKLKAKFLFILPDTTDPTVSDLQTNFQYPLSVTTLDPVSVSEYQVQFDAGGPTDAYFYWKGKVKHNFHTTGGVSWVAELLLTHNQYNAGTDSYARFDNVLATYSGSFGGFSDPYREYSLEGSKTYTQFNFNTKDQLYFHVRITIDQTIDKNEVSVEQYACELNISTLQYSASSAANTWLIADVIRQNLNVITNNKYVFRSSFFETKSANQLDDGCASKSMLTNGFQIRNFDVSNRPLQVDLKTILESLAAEYCIGINYSTTNGVSTVRMERADYFYQEKQILAIYEAEDYYEEVAKEIIYNEINIGYDKYQDTGFNTLDEFNTRHEELTPIQKNKAKLTQLSKFITSGYAIEIGRREQFSETPSNSAENDDEVFQICVRRDVDDSFLAEKDEAFETVSNVISPETSYNLRVSPARMLYNWFIWLKGIFAYKQPGDKIKTTFVAQNGDLTTRFNVDEPCRVGDIDRATIQEKADPTMSDMASTRDIYRPEWAYIKCRLNPVEVQTLNAALNGSYGSSKNYGYIMVRKPNYEWQAGWVFSLSYNYFTEQASIKMRKKFSSPEVPVDDNCCDYLVVNGCYVLVNNNKQIA